MRHCVVLKDFSKRLRHSIESQVLRSLLSWKKGVSHVSSLKPFPSLPFSLSLSFTHSLGRFSFLCRHKKFVASPKNTSNDFQRSKVFHVRVVKEAKKRRNFLHLLKKRRTEKCCKSSTKVSRSRKIYFFFIFQCSVESKGKTLIHSNSGEMKKEEEKFFTTFFPNKHIRKSKRKISVHVACVKVVVLDSLLLTE